GRGNSYVESSGGRARIIAVASIVRYLDCESERSSALRCAAKDTITRQAETLRNTPRNDRPLIRGSPAAGVNLGRIARTYLTTGQRRRRYCKVFLSVEGSSTHIEDQREGK